MARNLDTNLKRQSLSRSCDLTWNLCKTSRTFCAATIGALLDSAISLVRNERLNLGNQGGRDGNPCFPNRLIGGFDFRGLFVLRLVVIVVDQRANLLLGPTPRQSLSGFLDVLHRRLLRRRRRNA